jgi:hypothetical protein
MTTNLNVVFINLTEELVASEATEPRDPAHLFGATHLSQFT